MWIFEVVSSGDTGDRITRYGLHAGRRGGKIYAGTPSARPG